MKCWGDNAYGQLGDGTQTARPAAVDVLTDVAAISLGSFHSCALTRAGAVQCWGSNQSGQLGDGSTTNRNRPVPVPGMAGGITAISAGDDQTCAIQSGKLLCWGANAYTASSTLPDRSLTAVVTSHPVEVTGIPAPVAAVSVGWAHTCAIGATGGLQCWRGDIAYAMGTNPPGVDQPNPADVVGLTSGVASVSAGGAVTCAILASGLPQCWGYNFYGEVGDTTNIIRSFAVGVSFPQTSYQGLWWNSPAGSESGWGINLTHQGDVLFASWFTYGADGNPLWIIMANGEKTATVAA